MNKAILMGRLTRDPELRQTNSGTSICNFTIAVDRRFKNAQGEREVDFIPIVVWRQSADFVSRYFTKGQRIAVVGSIQVRSYDDREGNRRYVTEVIADEVYFADSKRSDDSGYTATPRPDRSYANTAAKTTAFNDGEAMVDAEEDISFFDGPDQDTSLPFDM